MTLPYRLIVWADADQETLLSEVAAVSEIEIAAVGSPAPGVAASLAKTFDAPTIDDLRQALLREDVAGMWVASAEPVDPAAIRLMQQGALPVFSAEPLPGTMADLSAADDAAAAHVVPLMRRSPGFRAAIEVMPQFGFVQAVNVNLRSGRGQGTLSARLFDAMDLIESLCGEAEMMDAALVSPIAGVPETLALLRGHMTMNLRFSGSRCACVAVSDHAGSWFRGVTVLGEQGCLRISDDGFEWIGLDGAIVDSHKPLPGEARCDPGTLAASHIVRIMEQRDTSEPRVDHARLLAICEAARLSCRTGQGEAPRKLLQMLSRP